MSSEYPWLCGTISSADYSCGKSSGSNVSDNESDLVTDLNLEGLGLYGLKLVYYPITHDTGYDEIFGEDQLEKVSRAFNFLGYTESIPPNVRVYKMEGIWGSDILTLYVSIVSFKYFSTYGGSDRNSPDVYDDIEARIGEVIYMPANDMMYEILDVKYYGSTFGLSSKVYTLTLRVYKDTKLTISASNPTLYSSDPIYYYSSSALSAQYPINDPLKINNLVSSANLTSSFNVNEFDCLWKN